jgi:hypothetical protein
MVARASLRICGVIWVCNWLWANADVETPSATMAAVRGRARKIDDTMLFLSGLK